MPSVAPDHPSVVQRPWSASVKTVTLVNHDDQEHKGPWSKSLRLRVELATAIPAAELQDVSSDATANDERWNRMLGIAKHPTYRGLFSIVPSRSKGATVYCLVPRYSGDAWTPYAYDVRPPPSRGNNLSALWWDDSASNAGDATAFIAPPLLFHARMSVFSIDSIDTVAQTFRASTYVELRLRAITNEPDEALVEHVLEAVGFRQSMIAMSIPISGSNSRLADSRALCYSRVWAHVSRQ